MYRPGSSLSRAKTNKQNTQAQVGVQIKAVEHKMPTLEEYIKNRDWVGAIAWLENEKRQLLFQRQQDRVEVVAGLRQLPQWGLQEAKRKAISVYDEVVKKPDYNKEVHIFKACCYYALCQYEDAKRECLKGPETPLQIRLLFHIAQKKNDDKNLMTYHHKLQDTTHDQLCLAAMHYLRGHFEEATDAYKKLLLENREFLALNVYVALCYYKMDYYDVSLEILQSYLTAYPTSVLAVNLKACNQYQLYSGKAAEDALKPLQQAYEGGNVFNDNDLLRHNLVVYRNGENALQVLPPLVEIFPEAKLNLIIYYLKNDDVNEAYNLVKDLQPTSAREYIIKAVVHAVRGQQAEYRDNLKTAQQLFQLVGSSASECDTIPGRQCMASCFYLLRQFDDVLVYLRSIRQFFPQDDDFNWDYGIACAGAGEYKEAEEALLLVQNERLKTDDNYLKWLTRVYIMNGKAKEAWELYINMETSSESFQILQLIANDCYKMGHFYYAAKAFDILERLDSEHEYEDALKGAIAGVFQMVVANKETDEHLVEAMNMLKSGGNNPQIELILKTIRKWGKDNNRKLG